MYCINCGYKLQNNMKFCPACGEKITTTEDYDVVKTNIVSSEAENNTANTKYDHSTSSQGRKKNILSLYGEQIEYDNTKKAYSLFMRSYFELSSECKAGFIKLFKQYSNAGAIVRNLESDYSYFINKTADKTLRYLDKLGIHSYDKDRFLEIYVDYLGGFRDSFLSYVDEYQQIVDDRSLANEYIDAKKNNRIRFWGGGFGISGAIKGMAMAGTANAVSGFFSSVAASMDRSSANKKYAKQFQRLTSVQYAESLAEGVCADIRAAIFAVEKILIDEFGPSCANPFKHSAKESDALFARIKNGDFSDTQERILIARAIGGKPYDEEMVRFAFERYGDANGELSAVIKMFSNSFDISKEKEKIEKERNKESKLETHFGEDADKIKDRFLKYGSYKDVILEKIGEDFFNIYTSMVECIPKKLKPFILTHCWKAEKQIPKDILDMCGCKLAKNEFPLLLIDSRKEIFENGILIITNKGLYGNKLIRLAGQNLSWDYLQEKIYYSYDRKIAESCLGMPQSWRYDVLEIIEAFYVLLVLAKKTYGNISADSGTYNEVANIDEMLDLNEEDFLDWIKSTISKKCSPKAVGLFAFPESENFKSRSFEFCPNLNAKKYVLFFNESDSWNYTTKGVLFTNAGLYDVRGMNMNTYIPYTKIESVLIKSFLGEKYLAFVTSKGCSFEILCADKSSVLIIAAIIEAIITYYRTSRQQNAALEIIWNNESKSEILKRISDLFYEEVISDDMQSIWYSTRVNRNHSFYLGQAERAYAEIQTDSRAMTIEGCSAYYITNIFFGLALSSERERGKEGFLLTDKGIYVSKNKYTINNTFIAYRDINKLTIKEDYSHRYKLEINSTSVHLGNCKEYKDLEQIVNLIDFISSQYGRMINPTFRITSRMVDFNYSEIGSLFS